MKLRSSIAILLIVFSLMLFPLKGMSLAADPLEEKSPSASAMLADFLVIRPLGVVSLALCGVFTHLAGSGHRGPNLRNPHAQTRPDDFHPALGREPLAAMETIRPVSAAIGRFLEWHVFSSCTGAPVR